MSTLSQKKSYPLYGQIKSDDVELLINDLELLEDGYIINYIIDPYDIINFCFPYGIKFHKEKRTLDEIGDEMIAYTYIFQNYNPIIVDEYRLELTLNRNRIHQNTEEHLKKNLFGELEERLAKANEKRKEKIYKELKESATFLFSTFFLTRTFINRFDSIYKDLQLDRLELQSNSSKNKYIVEKDEQIIFEIFRYSKRTPWSAKAFKEWVREKDENNGFTKLVEDEDGKIVRIPKTKYEIESEMKSAYQDFVVIDRLCNINRKINTNRNIRGKYLFLYFSSAEKSKEIFSMDTTIEHLPEVSINNPQNASKKIHDRYNIWRNVKHAYLIFLCLDKDKQVSIEDLKRIYSAKKNDEVKELHRIESDQSFDSERLYEDFEYISKNSQKEFEEESIKIQIKKHSEYKQSLENLIDKLDKKRGNIRELKTIYEGLLQDAITASREITPSTKMEVESSVQSSLSKLLSLSEENSELDLHKGIDLIEGNYQHLPILLFLENDNIKNELRTLLLEVIDFVVKSPRQREQTLRDFFENIKNLYTRSSYLYSKANEDAVEDLYFPNILIKSLIYLILPVSKNNDKHKKLEAIKYQEMEAWNYVRDTFEFLKLSEKYEDQKFRDLYGLMNHRRISYKKWHLDYRYFLIWSSRRNGDFSESIQLADKAIDVSPNDPRFHHGKCLALHNEFTKDNLTINRGDCLIPLIISAEKAIDLYTKLNIEIYKNFIKKSLLALQNTILYAMSLLHLDCLEKETNNSLITNPKLSKYTLKYLREKMLEKEIRTQMEGFSEFKQSEAILELCEAITFLRQKKYTKSVEKITWAQDAINQSLTIDSNSILYKETKQKINSWENKILSSVTAAW